MLDATQRELAAAGVADPPQVLLADAGYWHGEQMQRIVDGGIQVLIPPDTSRRRTTRRNWDGGRYDEMRELLATARGSELYRKRQPMIEPVFAQMKFNRRLDRSRRRGRGAVRAERRLSPPLTTSSSSTATRSPPPDGARRTGTRSAARDLTPHRPTSNAAGLSRQPNVISIAGPFARS
jgi:hypothetical protein